MDKSSPVVLTIAGSDSSSGAGIQADLKTFSSLGVYGCTVITAITAQNTKGIRKIEPISQECIKEQIRSVVEDVINLRCIKIGMVYDKKIIDTIVKEISKIDIIPIVLDPVLSSGTGYSLLQEKSLMTFVNHLIPLSFVITPNLIEAIKLSSIKIMTKKDVDRAAKKIKKFGTKNVIIKGGHFNNDVSEDTLLTDNNKIVKFRNPRMNIGEIHGAGCNFSSALTALLAKGYDIEESCKRSNSFIYNSLFTLENIGEGLKIANPISQIYINSNKHIVITELQEALNRLIDLDEFHILIPETQTNFVYAIENAKSTKDVAAIDGRIIKIGNRSKAASCISFGASKHVANAVLTYMEINPEMRSAINIKFDRDIIKNCKKDFIISSYNRTKKENIAKRKSHGIIKLLTN